MLNLVVWNSQGAEWDVLWPNYVNPLVAPPQANDVMALLVEAGWAPWVTPGDVIINDEYWLNEEVTWYDATTAAASLFCQAVVAKRRRHALWIPWVKNLNAMKTNTRCSMGAMFLPASLQSGLTNRIMVEGLLRPVVRATLGKVSGSNKVTPKFTILLVHMVSGYPAYAQHRLNGLISAMTSLIAEGTSAIIVGDMNVNLLTRNFTLPDKWRFLRLGVATQQKGGELDYGILFDPSNTLGGATANLVQQFKTGTNTSDHSVLRYDIPIS